MLVIPGIGGVGRPFRPAWYVMLGLVGLIGCLSPAPVGPVASPSSDPVPLTPPPQAVPLLSIPGPSETTGFGWQPPVPMHDWRYIVLHHTASDSGSVESIDRTHRDRTDANGTPWRGIGYHFVIGNGDGMADGEVQPTFRWLDQSAGAHAGVAEYNSEGIGICLVGNFEEHPPTSAQLAAVKRLVAELKSACNIGTADVLRHGDVKATACPGVLFPHEEIASVSARPVVEGRF